MSLQLRPLQAQRQELRLTPQLLQSIRLLQLSRTELMHEIQQELRDNPLLELVPVEPGSRPAPPVDPGGRPPSPTAEAGGWSGSRAPARGSSGGDELPTLEQTVAATSGLREHLIEQLREAFNVSRDETLLAAAIIYNLDDDGYLRETTLEELAAEHEVELEEVEDALILVQEFEPVGVGARSLAECLSLQARARWPEDMLLREVIEGYLDELERRNYATIARELGCARAEVERAHELVRELDPRPARQFVTEASTVAIPEISFRVHDDGSVSASLRAGDAPQVRVRADSELMLNEATGEQRKQLRQSLDRARSLAQAIQQRNDTLLRVAEAIIVHQRAFFAQGPTALRPLTLRQVADELELHESTISRITAHKYAELPDGSVQPLRMFFTSGVRTRGGDELSSTAVKHRILELIGAEDTRHPLSDQTIAERLGEAFGIRVARRTVAKYREALRVPPSSRRRSR